MDLWYDKPATYWEGALPLGNGRLGAMVYGGTAEEELQLNHDQIWSGPGQYELDKTNPQKVAKARELIKAGKLKEAHDYFQDIFLSRDECQSYQTAGSLYIRFDHDNPVAYRRELSLSEALSRVSYEQDGVVYTREAFSSYPDSMIVCRLTASEGGALGFTTRWESPMPFFLPATMDNATVCARGRAANMNPDYAPDRRTYKINDLWDEKARDKPAIRYVNMLKVESDGEVTAADGCVTVKGATEAVLFITITTTFDGPWSVPGSLGRDIEHEARLILEDGIRQGYDALKQAHLRDFGQLYARSALSIGLEKEGKEELPTDKLLGSCKNPADHPELVEKLYNYGRYLLIASSRKGSEPANLQGIWNHMMQAPWGGRYTININTEMNYWPAQVTNLADCEEPFLRMVKDLSESGKETARVLYDCDGWCSHHNTDIWRWSAYVHWGVPAAYYPLSGGWLARNIMEKFRFDGDKKALESFYPVLSGASRFFLDYLVENAQGKLVTCPSTSPENMFIDPATGEGVGASEGSAGDQTIIREIFENTLEAADLLGIDEPGRIAIEQALEKLEEHKIGSEGQLLEFQHDYEEYDIHHRHVSHLMGAYPAAEFTPDRNPELFAAARRSLERRGDKSTGWGMGWRVCLWARFLDGDRALGVIGNLLTLVEPGDKKDRMASGGGVYINLMDAHPPFQIDGNLGVTAGIAEMLLQSHRGFLDVLPALPGAWKKGSVKGLRARGGFTVDIEWDKGKASQVTVTSQLGNPLRIMINGKMIERETTPGEVWEL